MEAGLVFDKFRERNRRTSAAMQSLECALDAARYPITA